MTANRTEQAQLVLGQTLIPGQGVTQLALFDADGSVVDFTGLKQAADVPAVTTAVATDLPTAIALVNQLKITVNDLLTKLKAAGLDA